MLTKSKRILSAVLAVFMLVTVFLPMSASAADVTMDLSKCEVSWDYTLTDTKALGHLPYGGCPYGDGFF